MSSPTSTTPTFPAGVRLASPSDTNRLGSLAFTGASMTSEHKWLRPNATSYPQDAIDDFQNWFVDCLRSDDHILLFAEDTCQSDEGTKSGESKSSQQLAPSLSPSTPIVVGLALYQLRGMNKRFGQFQVTDGAFHVTSTSQGRDKDFDHHMDYLQVVRPLEMNTFIECGMTLETLIVHPAYWGKGHGKNLLKWAIDLAIKDEINIGVTATDMGIPIYRKLGFKNQHTFAIEGDSLSPHGVSGEIMMFSHHTHKVSTLSH